MAARFTALSLCLWIFWFSRSLLPPNYQHGPSDIQASPSNWSGKFLPRPIQCCRLKHVKFQAKFNISFPVQKESKRGQTTLALPAKLFVLDLTVFLDVQKHPGPDLQTAFSRPNLALVNLSSPVNNGVTKYSWNRL